MAAPTAPRSVFDVESFIKEYYDAWSGTDEDRILSYYTDDVVIQIPGALMEGKEALRDQFVRPFMTAFPGNWHRVKNIICGQDVVTVEFNFEAEHSGPFAGYAATGARVSVPGCGIYEYDSEKRQITAARIYFDVGTLLQTITDFPSNELEYAAEALKLSERNLSLIINTIPTAAWTTRADGYCDFLNQRWLDYAGITEEQAVGWGWAEAIHPDDRKRLVEYWQSSLTSGLPVEAEGRLRRFDGSYRWFLFRANPFRDQSGKIVKWYGTSIDIEDRKNAERALQESERNLSLTLNTIPTFIAVCGPDGSILWVNQAALDYHGISLHEVQKEDFRSRFFHPDDIERLTQELGEALKHSEPFECEYRALGKDGRYRWFLVRYNPLLADQGRIDRWYVTAFDIEDRKLAEDALHARELDVRSLLDNMPGLLARSSPDGTPEIFNRPFLQYLGRTMGEIGKWRTSDIVHPDELARTIEVYGTGISTGQPFNLEYRLRRFDGAYRWFEARVVPIRNGEGRILHWNALVTDIEDRKRAEDAQARQAGVRADVSAAFSKQTHLGEILHGCTEAIVRHLEAAFARIWMLNDDESMLELQASAGMYTRLDGSYSRIPVGDLKVGWIAREKKAHLTNDVMNDPRVNDKGWAQSNGMVAFAGYPLVVEDRLIGVVALFARHTLPESILDTLASIADTIAQGIERKRAEEALRMSERNLRQITNVIPAYIHVLRTDGSVLYANQAVLDTGVTLEEVQKEDYRDRFFHPEDVERLRAERREALTRAVPFENEQRVLGNDGKYRWFLVRYNPLLDEQGRIDRWYSAAFDIEDRKLAEAEIEQAYIRLAEAQRVSKTGSFISDLLLDEHNWSEELRRIFELDPGTKVTSEAIRALFHPEDLSVYEDAFKRAVDGLDRDIDISYRIITPAGNVKHLHAVTHILEKVAGRPIYIGAIQDVTESKVAEQALTTARAELAHMARVTTLSALTASISHEVNQPIAAAVTSAGACLRWLNRDQPDVQRAREAAIRIEHEGKRAAEIISHLKSFYKKDVLPQRETVSVNDLVEEMLVLLRSEAERHSVVMRAELTKDQLYVSADRVQLQQVLMNLMLNGMESMSEREGELKISTRREGEEVIVSVSDTGEGIPADKLEEIFNAFFTTKSGGTGMGLAISSTIIESHSGRLWATANPARGATFHFTLPTETETHK